MTELLHISRVDFRAWGGASGVEMAGLPPGLTVVLGDNETGKSSIASGLALLLTGGGLAGDFSPFGENQDRLEAALIGHLGDSEVRANLKTTLTKNTGKQKQTVTRQVHLGGVELSEDAFSQAIGGVSLENFMANYLITAEKIHLEAKTPDNNLSVGHIFGGIDPFVKATTLDTRADEKLGKSKNTKDSAWLIARLAKSTKTRLETARAAGGDVDRASTRLEQLAEDISLLRIQEDENKTAIKHLEDALRALPLHTALNSVQESENSPTQPSDADHELAAARERVTLAIENLDKARSETETATADVDQARSQAGDWAELADDLDTTDQRISDLEIADADVRFRRVNRDSALEARAVSESRPNSTSAAAIWGIGSKVSTATVLLALGAIIALLIDHQTTAQVLGLGAALTSVSLVMSRARKRDVTLSVKETEVPKAESRLQTAIERRAEILAEAGLPADRTPRMLDGTGQRLRHVAELKQAMSERERVTSREQDRVGVLTDLLTRGTPIEKAGLALDLACRTVDDHLAHQALIQTARDDLTKELGGIETEAEGLLRRLSSSELQQSLDSEKARTAELKGQITGWEADDETARNKKSAADTLADTEGLEIELAGLRGQIQTRLTDGLAHRLAAQILKESAWQYGGDNAPDILRRAEALATQIASDWQGLELDYDRKTGLRIRSTRGTHAHGKLSLGGRSGLNLALRLAAVETASSKLPVRLPLFLDDPLVHLDDHRRARAFQAISQFAKNHQVLYFTCHGLHAKKAVKETDAHLVELRGTGD